MARPGAIVAAMKTVQKRGNYVSGPSNAGMGRISPAMWDMYANTSYANAYGPFLPRDASVFTDGAFAPSAPIQPTPLDQPPPGATFPDPRWWQYRPSWNLPTPPGTEGLKLASFDQLRTLAQKYSVARACIELRIEEIRGLDWNITLTTDAAKAYQKDNAAMKDFGERRAKLTRFFRRPDPDFWNFDSFMNAFLEEIFVFDALSLIFRPKYGAQFGMGGRGLLGSDLDSIRLVSGPTIRPLIDLHGGKPAPPNPAFQQYLYGVPRSDYMTIAMGTDIDDAGLTGSEVNEFNADIMLYAPYWPQRESPYGFPPVERALLPIISGLQKQEFQLDYFTEGTIPAVYISPGDANITPTQIGELQNALNSLAGDPAYHLKVVVLPPGSKVEPQRPVDLSDSFDFLVMNQVCMAFDVQPIELGIIPNIGGSQQGPSASGIRFAGQEARDIKSRKSTKPLLSFIQDIFNYVIQDICGSHDMQFEFEGMVDDEDKQAITSLGVEQIQNGISSIDEVRERLDQPPWGLQETSEPIVMTQNGPIPFSMAPKLIQAMLTQGQNQQSSSSSSSSSKKKSSSSKPKKSAAKPKAGTSATKPNGSHSAPVSPSRPNPAQTPAHAAAQASLNTLKPQRGKTGGSAGATRNAGSRKRGEGMAPTQGRFRNKAAASELDMLRRFLRKDRNIIWTWQPEHITTKALAKIAEDLDAGILIDVAIDRQISKLAIEESLQYIDESYAGEVEEFFQPQVTKGIQFPGWEHDLGLVGRYSQEISQAFQDAEIKGSDIRKRAASGEYVTWAVMQSLVSDAIRETFTSVISPLYEKAWDLGYEGGKALVLGTEGDFSKTHKSFNRDSWVDKETQHWVDQIARTGLGNSSTRSEMIARTEVARAVNEGTMNAYRDSGVTHKHLLLAPDDACEVCKAASDEGIIPLDSVYPGGGPPFHPHCRCISAPAGVYLEPPQAHISKSFQEDPQRVAFLMIRGTDPDGKARYLLQKRTDDTWGLPGGMAHVGEEPFDAAVREATEEVGDLPSLTPLIEHRRHDEDKSCFVYLCEVPEIFPAKMNGKTPEETRGTGWFRKSEVSKLKLHPPFKDQWDSINWKQVSKGYPRNVRTENGEWLVMRNPQDSSNWPYPASGGGAQMKHPHDVNDIYHDGSSDVGHDGNAPEGGQDGDFGPDRDGGTPAKRPFRRGPDGMYPSGGIAENPSVEAQSVPGGSIVRSAGAGVPVVGAPKPMTPQPSSPMTESPEPYDPADAITHWDPEQDSNVIVHLPSAEKGAGGPSDYTDANPVDAEHVYVQMAKNFPPEAIGWIKRARWTGPHNVPWGRVDTDDIKNWAASHQPGKVKEFEAQIKAHGGHVAPSVLVQNAQHNKAFIVDGHHRALARKNLGQDVLAYLGHIDEKDRKAAEETHAHQIHSGASPQNKARQMVSKESVNYRHGTTDQHCGNCVMFHSDGTCDLVKGKILPGDTCDEWEAK